ncbi:hypothetical protein [Agaribacterium sp. ZY112]|uniref:hypothetical protein n=1 Tax=Agaribacterium sp. ZY112 TaxID=3233574 RepID=UPI0035235390
MNYELAFGDLGKNIENGLEILTEKYEYSAKKRKINTFNTFTGFVESLYGTLTHDNIEPICAHFRSYVYSERGNNTVITAHSDYLAWAALMRDLIQVGYLPASSIPQGLPSNHKLLKDSSIISCLGTMNPKKWRQEMHSKDLPSLQAMDDNEYLEAFMDSQLIYRNQLLNQARNYISAAANRFADGRRYIQDTDPSMFESTELLHTELKANGSGQYLSLFSGYLPNQEGLRNLVGFLYYKRNGFVQRDFVGANNHLYRFGGRIVLQEHLGLSTDLAAACAIVIVNETGINPESLYRLEFNPNTKTITPHDSLEAYFLNYDKPRAGGPINRLIKRDTTTINAEYCLRLIEKMTAPLRKKAPNKVARHLFIHDGVRTEGKIEIMSHTAFKSGFRRLVSRSNSPDLILSEPNLSKLRVTGGILAWYQSGGDPRAASRFLGNSTQVSIKNYIPKELQEFFYRKKIRQFQHLLIAVATDQKPYQQSAMNITSVEKLNEYLSTNIVDSDLYKRAKATIRETDKIEKDNTEFTFIISENNIAFLHAAQENHKINTELTHTPILKEWADIATLIFQFIRIQGTRAQKRTMVKGIDKNLNNPLILEFSS